VPTQGVNGNKAETGAIMRGMLLCACVGSVLGIVGQAAADVVTEWNQALLGAVASNSTAPPVAARAMAMTHLALFDAINAVDQSHTPYRWASAAAPGTSKQAAAASAAHSVLTHVFGAHASFDALRDAQLAAIPEGPAKVAGVALGQAVGTDMISARANDGSTAPSGYVPNTAPGHWRPTPPNFPNPALPQWASVTPFGMTSSSQFRPEAPPTLTSAAYTQAWNEVREIGSATSATRTQEQTNIARVWIGGPGTATPPGQWNQIAQQIAQTRGQTMEQNARMFALLGLAVADAGVVAWDCKYTYDLWRPITAIREGDTDGNPDTFAVLGWTPLLNPTPNHPTYVSGHSTFSSAAASMIALFLGTDNVNFTFTNQAEAPGVSRQFSSLSGAAMEAGLSRIYGGIHFGFDNTQGLACGAAMANWSFDRYLRPIPTPGAGVGLAMVVMIAGRRRRTR